jgi:low affinity Fe/Cu permease
MKESFNRFAATVAAAVGTYRAFMLAMLIVVVWAASGPVFHYSDSWQLIINTGTTVVTFIMVFVIQATQNRETRAIHLKLDELIRSSKARNAFADLEDASEDELDRFQHEFEQLRKQGLTSEEALVQARRRATKAEGGAKQER